MANDLAGFDPDLFRTNITNTMVMGEPVPDELKPLFHFRSIATYPGGTKLDIEGRPIDPRITPTLVTPVPVQVPVAVEYSQDSTNTEGLAGTFFSDRAIVTILDTQYADVATAIEIDLAGRRYLIQDMTVVGLGTVTVYQLGCFKKGTANE
jgi:hypothetical protein